MLYRALREAANLAAKYQIETDSVSFYGGNLYLTIDLKKFESLFFVKPIIEGNQRVYIKRFNAVIITATEFIQIEPLCEQCSGLGFLLSITGEEKDCLDCDTPKQSIW
jgi:hypothetical protein